MRIARRLLAALACSVAPLAPAQIPESYRPLVVEAPFSLLERRFDLNAALERARSEKKLLFVYLGARDCPYCTQYERFLKAHGQVLAPVYARHVVVDIRTWLKGPEPVLQVGKRKYTFGEFNVLVGDRGPNRPRYPYFWLVDPVTLKAKDLPKGSAFFGDIGVHRRALGG